MSRKRATQAELVARRQEIQELILEAHTKQFIVDRISEKYKTSKRAVQEDIRLIGEMWMQREPQDVQRMRNKYEERLELMFKKAFGMGQFKTALEIQKEIHKINGLYKEKEEVKDKAPEFINIGRKSPLKVVEGADDTEH